MFSHQKIAPDQALLEKLAWHSSWTFGEGEKEALRNFLFERQKGRCAYCESPLITGKIRIEHFHPRYISETLDPACIDRLNGESCPNALFSLNNLFLCCNGREGEAPREDTICDKRKENSHICADFYNPATSTFSTLVKVRRSGHLTPEHFPSSQEAALSVLNSTLNLNDSSLVKVRNDLYVWLLDTATQRAAETADREGDLDNFWTKYAERMRLLAESKPYPSVYLSASADFESKVSANP